MTGQFVKDAVERLAKTFAQALLAYFAADMVDVVSADWGEALTIAGTAAFLSILSSVLSYKVGNTGTASATDAVVLAPDHGNTNLRAGI